MEDLWNELYTLFENWIKWNKISENLLPTVKPIIEKFFKEKNFNFLQDRLDFRNELKDAVRHPDLAAYYIFNTVIEWGFSRG